MVVSLASRHAWIDIDRAGTYGHSGGGYAAAPALRLLRQAPASGGEPPKEYELKPRQPGGTRSPGP
jgi:hypothetical protein